MIQVEARNMGEPRDIEDTQKLSSSSALYSLTKA
jgi:hypothetical protein